MGLFSNLFGHAEEAPAKTQTREPAQERSSASGGVSQEKKKSSLPKLTNGMLLDVSLEENGKPLLAGKIVTVTARDVTLERRPGQLAFAMCEPGTAVTIRGYSTSTNGKAFDKTFDLSGVVEESTRVKCKIKDLRAIEHNEGRSNFRVYLNVPMTMYYEEDTEQQNPEMCTLVNISTGGACVESEFIHGEGEVLQLNIHIEPYAPLQFRSEVIRVDEPKPGIFRYGMLFAQLEEQEISNLTRMLFNIQVGDTGTKRRVSYGHW